ncbi:hypothetical protein BaRGS_00005461 [Batillaria attramentaria]|uniref:C-type lectin domain-containing protein n=1 Tax=Batillaria attramentaria TaxID=370345 RepID=A0ABD0LVJ0_9CAEN
MENCCGVVVILLLFIRLSGCDADYHVSRDHVSWKLARDQCDASRTSCLPTLTAGQWESRGLPEGLESNVPTWIGAKYYEKLVWGSKAANAKDNKFKVFKQMDFYDAVTTCDTEKLMLPSPADSSDDRAFIDSLASCSELRGQPMTTFWLNLTRTGDPFWLHEKPFEEDISNKENRSSGCIAMVFDSNSDIRFEVRNCSDNLRFVCSYDNADSSHQTSSGDQDVAIAAAATGAGALLIFIIVAVVLAGKLRRRKSSIMNSVSRSGEWDQGERMSRTWDRSSHGASQDDVDTSFSNQESHGARTAEYENTRRLLPSGSGTKANHPLPQNVYAVPRLDKGDKSYANTQPAAAVVGHGGYCEPQTGTGLYSEVDLSEKGGYAQPRSTEGDYAEIDHEKGDNAGALHPTAAADSVGETDGTAHLIGDSSLERHVGPMGDVYTEVRKDDTGFAVAKTNRGQQTPGDAAPARIQALSAEQDTHDGEEEEGRGRVDGVLGPLGDIYAEVQK